MIKQISPALDLTSLDSHRDSPEPALHQPGTDGCIKPDDYILQLAANLLTASHGDTVDQYLALYGQRDCAAAMHYAECHPERLPPPEDF